MVFLKSNPRDMKNFSKEIPDKVVSWTSREGCYTVQEFLMIHSITAYCTFFKNQSAVSNVVLSLTWLGYISMLRCNLTLPSTLAFS